MKHVWRKAKCQGLIWGIVLYIVATIMSYYTYNEVFRVIPEVLQNQLTAHDGIRTVIIFGIVGLIMDWIIAKRSLLHQKFYTGLVDVMVDKIIDIDLMAYQELSIAKITTVQQNIAVISKTLDLILQFIECVIAIGLTFYTIAKIKIDVVIPIVLISIISAFFVSLLYKKYNEIYTEKQQLIQSRNTELTEVINGFKEVRFFNAKENHRKSLHEKNNAIYTVTIKTHIYTSIIGLVKGINNNIVLIGGLILGLELIRNGEIESGTIVTLITLVLKAIYPITDIAQMVDGVSEVKAALHAFTEFMEYKNKVHDGTIELKSFDGSIELQQVSCEYDKSDTVLEDINISILKGQRIGITGESGSGKSTILNLIMRAFDVIEGAIKIDGIDIRKIKIDSFRKFIGIVSQDTFIFNTTIRENIAYAIQQRIVTDNEIIKACKKAKLWKFIQSLPSGLDTKVGERGLKLSGGQKQRISLARIMLADPQIIILDEATSALDNMTEKAIKKILAKMKGKTIIAVAHRLSTIQDYDKILVVGNKHVLAEGTHDELMKLCDIYRKLALAEDNDQE